MSFGASALCLLLVTDFLFKITVLYNWKDPFFFFNPLLQNSDVYDHSRKSFENIVGKGENAGKVISIFSFSHNIFYHSNNGFQLLSHFFFFLSGNAIWTSVELKYFQELSRTM